MNDHRMRRCPYCEWSRRADPAKGAEPWSEVTADRELAVHLVLRHAEEFRDLAQTVSDEWAKMGRG